MNPSYIYFKELDIDSENIFSLNFSKENEIENVFLDKDFEYAITGLNLNVKIPEDQVIKIEDEKKLNEKNEEIRELIKIYKEADLTLHIENTETAKIKIPFTKKTETDLPLIKYNYFDTITKKTENLFVYDFAGNFEKYGFQWGWNYTSVGFRYSIKKVGEKIQKKIYLKSATRRRIVVDESRFFNMMNNFTHGDKVIWQKRL